MKHKLSTIMTLAIVLLALGGRANAQYLFVNPPEVDFTEPTTTPTLQIVVDTGIESAVAWGTTITLQDPASLPNSSLLTFLPFSDGAYFHQDSGVSAFFDTDLSPTYAGGQSLTLAFLDTQPNAVLGLSGRVVLGTFQISIHGDPGFPLGAQVALAPLDYPPFGSAVLDAQGDNLLVGVNGANVRSPAPEPSGLLALGTGIVVIGLLARRRQNGN